MLEVEANLFRHMVKAHSDPEEPGSEWASISHISYRLEIAKGDGGSSPNCQHMRRYRLTNVIEVEVLSGQPPTL
jgi:hypothetical protein